MSECFIYSFISLIPSGIVCPQLISDNCNLFTEEASLCDTSPCMNEGTCINEISKFKCLCKSGFRGDHCEGNHYANSITFESTCYQI